MGRGSPRGDAFDLSPGKMRKRGLSPGGAGSTAQTLQRGAASSLCLPRAACPPCLTCSWPSRDKDTAAAVPPPIPAEIKEVVFF